MSYSGPFGSRPGSTPQTEQETHERIAASCTKGILEIGVLDGTTSATLCRGADRLVPVFGVDPLIPDSMEASLIGSADRIRDNTRAFPNYTFIQDYSFNVAKTWDRPLDYVFIDGSHFYKDVKRDYEDWFPKISVGGYISFHDSCQYRGGPPFHEGSSKFVDEILLNDNRLEYIESVFCLTVFRKKY